MQLDSDLTGEATESPCVLKLDYVRNQYPELVFRAVVQGAAPATPGDCRLRGMFEKSSGGNRGWSRDANYHQYRQALRYRSDRCGLDVVAPMLPAARSGGRPRTTNIRAVLNAIFYPLRTGCQLRLLPKESFQCGAPSITTSGLGRTVVSGLASSAQCISKLDGKPAGPPVRRSSSWMASR